MILVMTLIITKLLASASGQSDIVLNLSADRSEIGSGNRIGMSLVVINLNVKDSLELSEVVLTLPSGWNLENNEENVLSMPLTIMPNSSKLVDFSVTIPTDANTGNYSIFVSISATRNSIAYSETSFTEISVTRPPDSILQQIDWDAVWILFLVYAIPGVVIERVVEVIKLAINRTRMDSAHSKADRATIEKLKATELKELTVLSPPLTVDKFLKKLSKLEDDASKEDYRVNRLSYILSIGMGLVAASVLMSYGIGLLQIAGFTNFESKVADVVVGALIIAFVTKPTHDIIKIIESIRTVKM
jgi:hypothetical protein